MTSLPPTTPPAPAPPPGGDRSLPERIGRTALIVGIAGIVLCVLGFFLSRRELFGAYLYAYMVWLGVPLGCGAVLMVHHLTGGRWGLVIRRLLEAGTRTLPVMALLFLPLLLGLQDLYPWAVPDAAAADEALAYKRPFLNIPAFLLRAVVYFAIWLLGMWLLNRWSDRADDPAAHRRLAAISGPGLVVYVLTMSAAAVDWIMSIDPHWYSTIFGVILIIGQALSALALIITLLAALSGRHPFAGTLRRDDFHDLGNLLMTCVMLWAYVQFSQFLIVWMGNVAENTPYYVARLAGGWGAVAVLLVILHFAVPLMLLLSRTTKRTVPALAAVAAGIFLMRFIDLAWIVKPFFAHAHLTHPPLPPTTNDAHAAIAAAHPTSGLHWLDLVTPFAIGGIWTAVFIRELGRRPLLPENDPRLLAQPHGEHHHD